MAARERDTSIIISADKKSIKKKSGTTPLQLPVYDGWSYWQNRRKMRRTPQSGR